MVKFWVRWRWLGLDQREVASATPRAAARAYPRGVVRECPRFVTLGPKKVVRDHRGRPRSKIQ